MQILVNTGKHISGGQELTGYVESTVENTLSRFGERVTRVEVYLTDESSREKDSDNDKRCVMEARLAGLDPITVSAQGAQLEQAIDGAADILEKRIGQTLERLEDPKGRTSFAGEQGA